MSDSMQQINRTPPAVHLHFAGREVESGSGGIYKHINSATGQVQGEIPLAGAKEMNEAVEAAQRAFETWRRTAPAVRRQLLTRLAELIVQNGPEFARRGTLDNGTPIAFGYYFPQLAAEWTSYYAGWADKIDGRVASTLTTDGEFSYTLAQPYGVVGIIITWNGPLISLVMKIPAALAAGNTVVVKPSEMTPYSADLFARLVKEAGFPDGVVNILPGGIEAGEALVKHPLVKKISFTGGPATARRILADCAELIKPVVLELGGKSANIVFPDADIEAVCASGTMGSIGLLSGQGCAFPTRMLVHRDIYEPVLAGVTAVAQALKLGDPFDMNTQSGPLINQAAVDRVLGMIERAKSAGARLLTGGNRLGAPFEKGYYVEPTVFADVNPKSELAQQEVFGPVLAIIPFTTEEEAIHIANDTLYGLSSWVQTRDIRRAQRVAESLMAGEVMINGCMSIQPRRPFGGFGISGIGKEGGREGLEEFLRVKTVGLGQ